MKPLKRLAVLVFLVLWTLSACQSAPAPPASGSGEREILYIYPDGSMRFRGRLIPRQDVFIYEDGYGGEWAAVRIKMEPLHPDFFHGTIAVERVRLEGEENRDEARLD